MKKQSMVLAALASVLALTTVASPAQAWVNEYPSARQIVVGGPDVIRIVGTQDFSVCDKNTNAPGPVIGQLDFVNLSVSRNERTHFLKGLKNFTGLKNTCKPGEPILAMAVPLPVASAPITIPAGKAVTFFIQGNLRVQQVR